MRLSTRSGHHLVARPSAFCALSRYNFKNGADNETEEQRKSREAVKNNARRRAMDRFDEEKTVVKKMKRRKSLVG